MKATRIVAALAVLTLIVVAAIRSGAIALTRGQSSAISSIEGTLYVNSSAESDVLSAAYVGSGHTELNQNIGVLVVRYDLINQARSDITSWTIFYDPAVAADVMGVELPRGYLDSRGKRRYIGGDRYCTEFVRGYGTYYWNRGIPWIVDYRPDHITFSTRSGMVALPRLAAAGVTDKGSELPTFGLILDPEAALGKVNAEASARGSRRVMKGRVLGPVAE